MEKNIQKFEGQANDLIEAAKEITIDSEESMKKGTEFLSLVNKKVDEIKKEKEKVTKPLNEALKAERGRWKPVEELLKPVVAGLRTKMNEYQTKLVKEQEADEAKIAARMKKGKGNFKPETAIRKMGEVDAPDAKVETDAGSVGFRKKKIVKISDENKIPKKFLIVDVDAVFTALKDGEEVPGAELDFEMVPVNKR